MARFQERLEFLPCLGGLDLAIAESRGDINRGIMVGVRLPAAYPTAKRLLFWAIAPSYVMTTLTFLRGVGALD